MYEEVLTTRTLARPERSAFLTDQIQSFLNAAEIIHGDVVRANGLAEAVRGEFGAHLAEASEHLAQRVHVDLRAALRELPRANWGGVCSEHDVIKEIHERVVSSTGTQP